MANIASARKRVKQIEKRRQLNASQRSLLRTRIKRVVTAIKTNDREAAMSAYQETVPFIDRMANKRLIHKNKAARHKRQLSARLKAMQSPA